MWKPGKPSAHLDDCAVCECVYDVLFTHKRNALLEESRCITSTCTVISSQPLLHNETLKITFVNVGQGDCILIELPHRQGVYMIDTGGLLRFEQEAWKERHNCMKLVRQIVVPYLKGKGIASLDTFILAMPMQIMSKAAEEILKEIRIKEIHITPQSHVKEVMKIYSLRQKNNMYRLKNKLQVLRWQKGDAIFRYIWPTDTDYEGNNDSLVLMMTYGAFKALFTGDLEEAGEQVLIRQEGG